MTTLYADTSFLVTLFVDEARTREALHLLKRLRAPLNVTWFTMLEATNTLRRLRFETTIDEITLQVSLERMRRMREDRILLERSMSSTELAAKAEELSERFTVRTGVRTLDLLHIASARLVKASLFLTFDRRQLETAKLAGLQTAPPLRRSPSR